MNDRYYNVGLIDLEGMYKMCNEILDYIARGERTVIDIEEYIIYQQTAINDKINTELGIMSNYYRSDWNDRMVKKDIRKFNDWRMPNNKRYINGAKRDDKKMRYYWYKCIS